MPTNEVFLLQSTGFLVILGGVIYEVLIAGIATLCRRARRAIHEDASPVEDASGILMRLT